MTQTPPIDTVTATEHANGTDVPRHVAIIMDGNGRWAQQRSRPRVTGHVKGVQAVRAAVEYAASQSIAYLTLFAFSSENWRRPADEVSVLMRLFMRSLESEVDKLDKNDIRLRVVGDLGRFDAGLRARIDQAEQQTAGNNRMVLTVAANYGGRWDILNATRQLLADRPDLASAPANITEADLEKHLAMAYAPEPDLFIRTGGEQRVSNFLLWQLAYTEMYFTPTYWPDFNAREFARAVTSYQQRERRFGQTSAQVATV